MGPARERGAPERRDPVLFRTRVVLGVVLAGLVAHLLLGEKPWSGGVAQRLEERQPVLGVHYAETWTWWAALANAFAVTALLATARRWGGGPGAPERASLAPPPGRARGAFALAVSGAMLASAALAFPRLSQSFWDDEEETVRRFVHGRHQRGVDGELAFVERGFEHALWDYRVTNNQVLYSVLARSSLLAWDFLDSDPRALADERAVRLPAYLSGIASLGALAALLRRVGLVLPGAFAAWVLAIHPWHLRYTSEARGYSLLLLLIPTAAWLLVRALHRGTWGRWLLYATPQLLMLWTFPASLVLVAVINAAAAATIRHVHGGTPDARAQTTRWAVASLASGLVALQVMLPNAVQLLEHGYVEVLDELVRDFPRDLGAHLVAGVAWCWPEAGEHHVELCDVARAAPVAFWTWLAITALLAAAGALRLFAAGGLRAALAAVLVLPAPLTWTVTSLTGAHPYPWHLSFALASFAALVAVGFPAPRRTWRWLTPLAMAAWLAAFAAVTQPARRALRERPLQPLREAVLAARPTLDPFAPENQRIVTLTLDVRPLYYDPLARVARSEADLRAALAAADARGETVFVHLGRPWDVDRKSLQLVRSPAHFEPVAVLHGFEPRLTRTLLRYRSGSLAAVVSAAPPATR
jgi:hypothetical protein